MDYKTYLMERVSEYGMGKGSRTIYRIIKSDNLSFENIRDKLMRGCQIVEELPNENTVVFYIDSGFWGRNKAIMACKIDEQQIYVFAFANEGLINQHTVDKAINMFEGLIK